MTEDCLIPENNIKNVQFYISQSGKNIQLEFHLSAGLDNSMTYLKFTVKVAGTPFRYWIHPNDEWLKRFCQTCQVSIIGPSKNILVNLKMPKEELVKIMSEFPQCKDWFEK